jgi:GTP-binding protein LepA
VRLNYRAASGECYVLNLIDAGRRLLVRGDAVARRALLLVDASQGVEAQTLANAYAVENDLDIIPVINKIDLPWHSPAGGRSRTSSASTVQGAWRAPRWGRAFRRSSKTRPSPAAAGRKPTRRSGPIFDSWAAPTVYVVIVVRVIDGVLRPGMKIRLMAEGQDYDAEQVGAFSPKPIVLTSSVWERWVFSSPTSRRSRRQVGDTIRPPGDSGATSRIQGLKPMVFAGLYPVKGISIPSFATRSRSSAERRVALLRAGDVGGAGLRFRCGFWACCTWRSCRTARASSTSTW